MKAPNRAALALVCCLLSLSLFAQGPGKRTVSNAPSAGAPVDGIAARPVAGPTVVSGLEGAAATDDGRVQVLVELLDRPAALIYADVIKDSPRSDLQARNAAAAATIAQVARINAAQQTVAAVITSFPIGARELYRVHNATNGIAVAVDRSHLRELAATPGVKRILPINLEFPTSSNSVPFLGTPKVWANTIGLPAGADGTGVRVGIIDTGIDYMHADFGGTGLLADYQAESTDTANFTTVGTAVAGPFPTAKVVGGTDFAGDGYTGGNAPVPDANPMDCNGHGSHVSGTAAGFGVTSSGATFTGPYDANNSTYSPLRIQPGTAPKASLYALRVFGCSGGTGLTTLAIDWAMDPNGDADLSDHLDVINMSLGSDYGSAINSTSVASDNAALAGVIVVTSAGNSSDTFFIAGAPGVATRVISTAASVDDGIPVATVVVNSPPSVAGSYVATIPQYGPTPSGQTAPGVRALDAANASGPSTTDACTALTNAAAIAGNICVVDRGTCSFKTKTLNCQVAGAIGVLAVDNAPGSPPPGTADDPTIVTPITIPTERITLADGTLIKNAIISSPPVSITLNASSGADTLASFSSRGPRRTYGSPLQLKPDVAAPGLNITSVQTGHTCTVAAGCTGVSDPSGFQAGSQTLTISGTSMASPHVAGIMALLRQLKPDWSVEELKALAMNYAVHDVTQFPAGGAPRFGPSRVGGGRVDPASAAVGNVIALNADDAGLVSVTFNPEVTGVVTQVKKVRLVNKGLTSQTYNLAFDNVIDSPGVSFSLPGGSSVTVPAGQSMLIDVQMSANASLMDHTKDPALLATQGVQANYGDQPRNFLTEEASYLTFSQSATLKFRLPVYMAEKPTSNMSAADTIVTGGAPTGSTTIALSGTDVCSGTLAAGPTCTGTFPNDVESLVTPFELQVVSGINPSNAPDYADIHYVGTSFLPGAGSPSLTNDLIMFGVASWGNWSSPNEVSYNICIDNNSDGVYDKIIYNSNPSIFVANASPNDNFVRIVRDTATNGNSILGLGSFVNLVAPSVIDSALHLNNVMVLGASPSQLGFASTAVKTFRYKVVTCAGNNPGCARTTTGDRCSPPAGTFLDQEVGPYTYNWGTQGLNFSGNFLAEDLNGSTLPVTWNTANMTANGSLGGLILHHHNATGKRAEVVLLDTAAKVDLAVAAGAMPASPALGAAVTVTVTITNPSATTATSVEVFAPLPNGLTYVSDSAAGAYNAGTGIWTVGTLPTGTLSLTINTTVNSTDPQVMTATITGGLPLDPNPSNNVSSFTVSAPRSGDLAVTMTTSSPSALVGTPISYTITVKNNGIDPAYSINVADSFPSFPALTVTSSTASQGVFNAGTGTWNLAGLGSGFSATLTLGLNAPNMAGGLQNSATASSPTADPNALNNTDAKTITILSPSNVNGVKNNNGPKPVGGTVTYTITLTNSGSFTQQDNPGAEMTDILPSTLTLVSANATTGTAVATVGTNTVTWNGSIGPSGTVTVTVTATVNGTATVGSTISNTSTISYDADGNGTNEATHTAGSSFVVISPALITGTKVVSGQFRAGGSVTYTVVLSNSSTSAQLDNPGNEFTDVLPASLTLVSANATSGTAVATVGTNTVSWNGSIAGSGSVTITINATVSPSAAPFSTISNQGSISYDADGNQTNEASAVTNDPGTAAPNDATSFTVSSPATIGSATMTAAGTFHPGSNVVYTVVLTNSGPSAQLDNPGDEFTDVLPGSLTLVSAIASSGTASLIGNTGGIQTSSGPIQTDSRPIQVNFGPTVHWNGQIPPGGSVTITITTQIAPATPGGTVISNQGTAFFDADGNGTNESSLVTNDPSTAAANDPTSFMVVSPATISSPSKSVAPPYARHGDTVTYTIFFTNTGSSPQSDNPGDEFTDVLPATLNLVSATASSGTATTNIPARTVHWNGAIPVGGSVTVTITATVATGAADGTTTNQGTVFFDADGNGTNESSALTNDPSTPAPNDPTALIIVESSIPAVSPLGLLLLSLLLAGAAMLVARRGA